MSNETCRVVKIKSVDPKSQGPFVEINESDYNPEIHELFEPTPPAPVNQTPPSEPVNPPAPAPIAPPAPVVENPPVVDDVKITDEAKVLAAEADLDVSKIVGTGENGEITEDDVYKALEESENDGE